MRSKQRLRHCRLSSQRLRGRMAAVHRTWRHKQTTALRLLVDLQKEQHLLTSECWLNLDEFGGLMNMAATFLIDTSQRSWRYSLRFSMWYCQIFHSLQKGILQHTLSTTRLSWVIYLPQHFFLSLIHSPSYFAFLEDASLRGPFAQLFKNLILKSTRASPLLVYHNITSATPPSRSTNTCRSFVCEKYSPRCGKSRKKNSCKAPKASSIWMQLYLLTYFYSFKPRTRVNTSHPMIRNICSWNYL